MGKLVRYVKTMSGGLIGLLVMLIVLFFILNFIAQRGWGPISTIAGNAEAHANGSAYAGGGAGTPVAVVGTPSTPGFGPHI